MPGLLPDQAEKVDIDINTDIAPYEETSNGNAHLTHVVNPLKNLEIWEPGMTAQDVVYVARLNGQQVTTLCDYKFVPRQNPENYPPCQKCFATSTVITIQPGKPNRGQLLDAATAKQYPFHIYAETGRCVRGRGTDELDLPPDSEPLKLLGFQIDLREAQLDVSFADFVEHPALATGLHPVFMDTTGDSYLTADKSVFTLSDVIISTTVATVTRN